MLAQPRSKLAGKDKLCGAFGDDDDDSVNSCHGRGRTGELVIVCCVRCSSKKGAVCTADQSTSYNRHSIHTQPSTLHYLPHNMHSQPQPAARRRVVPTVVGLLCCTGHSLRHRKGHKDDTAGKAKHGECICV